MKISINDAERKWLLRCVQDSSAYAKGHIRLKVKLLCKLEKPVAVRGKPAPRKEVRDA